VSYKPRPVRDQIKDNRLTSTEFDEKIILNPQDSIYYRLCEKKLAKDEYITQLREEVE